ncbi:MAG TPA: TonB-dependent receptor [Gemmatimonadaceae bacterium]|nr:TonB-dependent receptor [Gemmatimonadaceae bacterium]
MRRMLAAALAITLAVGNNPLNAQAPGPQGAGPQQPPAGVGEVRGTVSDEANAPLSGASVAVRSKATSALVAGAFVRPDGTFRVTGLPPGTYIVRVTSMGFGPKSSEEFTITPATAQANVGTLKMGRVAVALQGVEVKAEREAVTIEPDRNSYRAKDVAATANNASDVLDAVPSVQVDGEGKVSLRGNENVAIQINGRPAPIRGPQLAAYLKQIPATIVERIEVVPTPSARYDPEGMAGIINIVLKQNADLGMSGGFTLASATAAGRYNGSGNVANQTGPWTLFSSYGFNSDDREIVGINDRERYNALRTPLSITEQDILGQDGAAGHNFTTNLDYKINNRDLLTNAIALNLLNATRNTVSEYTELTGSRSLLDRYSRIRDADVKNLVIDYTLAFKRTLVPRKHELSTEIRFNRAKEDENTNLWRQSLSNPASRVESELNDTDALTQSVNAQLDYTRTLAERTKLESGYKGTGRWLDRDFLVRKDPLGTGSWAPSDLSNDFSFDEQVQAAYGVLSHGVGKFELQGGLRAEYASRDFTLKKSDESYPFSYTSLFPSAVVNYKVSDATQAKIAYSRRIRRPGTQELNPFPVYFDNQNIFLGNPQLNPEYTDAIELGLTKNGKLGTLQLSPFFRHTADVIRVNINTADTFEGREVTSISFQNLATSNSYGTDVNGQLRLGKKFTGFGSFNVFKMVTDGGSESSLGSNAVTWSTRWSSTVQVTPMLTFQGSYFYRAPMKIERGEFGAAQMANLSLRQKIMQEKATISFRVQDPFNTMGMKIKTGDDNVMQFTERKFGVRAAFLTFQYNFGQAPRIRQPRPEDNQPQPSTGFPSGD